MKCSDIPDRPILALLAALNGRWANWWGFEPSVLPAFPEEVRGTKLVLAKMRMMVRRGVVDGCCCGCRGDFVITPKGLRELGETHGINEHEKGGEIYGNRQGGAND